VAIASQDLKLLKYAVGKKKKKQEREKRGTEGIHR
jgi:hypothetical protein